MAHWLAAGTHRALNLPRLNQGTARVSSNICAGHRLLRVVWAAHQRVNPDLLHSGKLAWVLQVGRKPVPWSTIGSELNLLVLRKVCVHVGTSSTLEIIWPTVLSRWICEKSAVASVSTGTYPAL